MHDLCFFQNNDVMEKCLKLFKLDYNTVEINNANGELSSHYPSLIVIPENEIQKPNGLTSTIQSTSGSNGSVTPPPNVHGSTANNPAGQQRQQTIYENSYDATKLRDIMNKARFARSRTRFPVPVILYKGKFVCRSSTLSCGPELYTRSSFNYFFNASAGTTRTPVTEDVDLCLEGKCFKTHLIYLTFDLPLKFYLFFLCFTVFAESEDAIEVNESSFVSTDEPTDNCKTNSDWPLFDHVRSSDIRLLKTLNVGTIVDFMVEKKKVKFGLK